MKFIANIQYRVAAYAGIATQLAWGTMEILVYRCFYLENQADFPMQMQALASYIWLQQGLLALFNLWSFETEIFQSITKGDIAYELCRPCGIYEMWFSRTMALRLSAALLRCVPLFAVAVFVPEPYGLGLPASFSALILFVVSMLLGFLNVVAFGMLIYISAFFTISVQGVRIFSSAMVELLAGAVVPLPFWPDGLRQVVELLPFAAMQNTPLRIYGGDIAGIQALQMICLQLFWLAVMVSVGKLWMNKALKQVVVQGG